MQDQMVLEPIRVPLWAWLVAGLALFALYVLTVDNGAVLAEASATVHEFVHDTRHFAGMPCH